MARLTKAQTTELKRIAKMIEETRIQLDKPVLYAPDGTGKPEKVWRGTPIPLVAAQNALSAFLVENQFKNRYGFTDG